MTQIKKKIILLIRVIRVHLRQKFLLHSPTPPLAASPFPFTRSRLKNTESEWETSVGGGLKAVGVGAGVTGFGADLIIIDDPVKSRAEAESKTFRDRLWNWFNNDLYTRLEPDGSIILIQTRWHEDDLAGRLLRDASEGGEQWEVVNLPALAEGDIQNGEMKMNFGEACLSPTGTNNIAQGKADAVGRNPGYNDQHDTDPEGVEQSANDVAPFQGANTLEFYPGVTSASRTHPRLYSLSPSATGDERYIDVLGRKIGEALCPERFDEQKLEQYRRQLGSYSFAALYQQRPSPAEGGMFKRHWFKITNFAPPNLKWKRGYDLGISKNADADYTASVKTAYDKSGDLYIDGAYRARIEYPEQRRYILGRIDAEPEIDHGVELSANGNAVIQDLRTLKKTQGRTLRGIHVKGDKLTRALGWLALAEEGKVHLVRGAWNDEFIDEAASFPTGTHDDQIDAVSLTIQMHRQQKGRSHGFTWKELYGNT